MHVIVRDPESIAGKRVLVIEDGPTLTHGEMPYGAGVVAAKQCNAAELIDPRPYAVGSIKFVKQALISSGEGWLDADPEIQRLKPDIYAVNEDGDRGGKREYCAQHGIEYLVLKRAPAPGLPRRTSTELRGF